MTDTLTLLSLLLKPIGFAFTLIYLYSLLSRTYFSGWMLDGVMGCLMGFAALMSMVDPMTIGDGFRVDARMVFVGLATGLFGWVAACVAGAIALYSRMALGGAGASIGMIAIAWTIGVALIWRHVIRPRMSRKLLMSHIVLGALVASHVWLGALLPVGVRATYFQSAVPISVPIHVLATMFLGWLLSRERLLLDEVANLRTAAETDPLTDALNRRSTQEIIESMNRGPIEPNGRGLIVFDIDRFKQINDTYGHPVGDAILMAFSGRIRSCLRGGDLFVRLGGDEFVVVLPDTHQRVALDVAERCRSIIADAPFKVDDLTLSITTSIGLTWSPLPPSFDDHVAAADVALYAAKRGGRNRVEMGQPILRKNDVRAVRVERAA